jgi:putative transposase
MKTNAIGFYSIRGNDFIDFQENSKKDSFKESLRKIREANKGYRAVLAIVDNFRTHISKEVREYARKIGVYLIYLPPYSPDLNPIEFIWKSIKRVLSIIFVENIEAMMEIIERTFYKLAENLSFAKSWIDKFIPSWI